MKHLISSRIEMDGGRVMMLGCHPKIPNTNSVKLILMAECDSGYVRYALNGPVSATSPGIVPTAKPLEIEVPTLHRLEVLGPDGSFVSMIVFIDAVENPVDFSLKNPHHTTALRLKGAVHSHSTNSDGEQSPTAVMESYRDIQGFDFNAITDHNYVTPDPEVSNILGLRGQEISTPYLGKVFHEVLLTDLKPGTVIVSQGGYSVLVHPYYWGNNYINPPTHLGFIDCRLTDNDVDGYYERGWEHAWDYYLALITDPFSQFLWGMSSADSHDLTDIENEGNRAMEVCCAEETKKDILANLLRGNFYAFHHDVADAMSFYVSLSGKTITARADEASIFEFRGLGGILLKREYDVLSSSYTIKGTEKYVRAVCIGPEGVRDKTAFSQPIHIYDHRQLLAAYQGSDLFEYLDVIKGYIESHFPDMFYDYLKAVRDYILLNLIAPIGSNSAMGADLSGTTKWGGGVLGLDGKIYGAPRSSTDILIINPIAGTATRSAMGADLSGSNKWVGGCLGPNGKIYCIPYSATDILIIDPLAGTATRSAMGADLTGTTKWVGGVLGPDGKIYCIPYSATDILIIDPIAGTAARSAMGADLTGSGKWYGGGLGPDGKIYGIPYTATDILIIDPLAGTATRSAMGADLTGSSKWQSGVLGPDGKIYGIPCNSADILIIDPTAGTATRSAMGASLSDTEKWLCGVLGPDGKIYGIPYNPTDILIIDPIAGTATRSAMGADLTGSGKWASGVLGPDGNIYGIPRNATTILKLGYILPFSLNVTQLCDPRINKY